MIDKKEDILEYLADEEGGALEIDEDVIESYDRVKEDIEVTTVFSLSKDHDRVLYMFYF